MMKLFHRFCVDLSFRSDFLIMFFNDTFIIQNLRFWTLFYIKQVTIDEFIKDLLCNACDTQNTIFI